MFFNISCFLFISLLSHNIKTQDSNGKCQQKLNIFSMLYNNLQILNESPICFSLGLPSTGKSLSNAEASKAPQAAAVGDADADLEARLDNLRRQ